VDITVFLIFSFLEKGESANYASKKIVLLPSYFQKEKNIINHL